MFERHKLFTLFTFAKKKSIQGICYLGKNLAECLVKKSFTKPINDGPSNNNFTLENVRKFMGHMELPSRDLVNEVYGPRNLFTNGIKPYLLDFGTLFLQDRQSLTI